VSVRPSASEALLRARDVAELLDVTADTVLDWFEAGGLPGFRLTGRVGSPVRFRKSEVLAALESWRVRTLAPAEVEA
jgi:excisionase family DNA binding protein